MNGLLVLEKIFKEILPCMGVAAVWSYNTDYLKNSKPWRHHMEFGNNQLRVSKTSFKNVDRRTVRRTMIDDAEACLSYKLPEAFGSGELKS